MSTEAPWTTHGLRRLPLNPPMNRSGKYGRESSALRVRERADFLMRGKYLETHALELVIYLGGYFWES